MKRSPHPIPYQGSKRKLAPIIAQALPARIERFYEPFAGSAAMTIHAAGRGLAPRFVLADSLGPMVALHRSIVEEPERVAARYRALWEEGRRAQRPAASGSAGAPPDAPDVYEAVRARFNADRDPLDLLYLICRCVQNAVRFARDGRFTQAQDRRRLGMRPEKMEAAVHGVSALLRGRIAFRTGDWRETVADARADDFVYLDPPYLGTTIGRDRRYHAQLGREALCEGLADLRARGIRFALSYDGTTGGRDYGPPLPEALGLTRLLLPAGPSSQATLSGRREETVESLYLSPGLAPPAGVRAAG